MTKINKFILIRLTLLIVILTPIVSAQAISVEYFYQTGCHDCKMTDPIIDQIEEQHEDIIIIKTDVTTTDGFNQWNQYGFLEVPAVVINNETKIPKGEITEEKLNQLITEHLETSDSKNDYINTTLNAPFAYSLGLFAGMSPCLMAILGFLLSFTAGTSESVRNGMTRALTFSLGLIASYLIIGVGILSFRKAIPDLEIFSLITGIIVIITGLYLMGLFKVPISLDRYFQNSARKYAGTFGGLFFLGVLFSFVKVPCTVPMLLVLLNKTFTTGSLGDLSLLIAFSLGVLTPFIGVGLIGSYTLSKHIRSYRSAIKLISGIGLVLFGFWVIL